MIGGVFPSVFDWCVFSIMQAHSTQKKQNKERKVAFKSKKTNR